MTIGTFIFIMVLVTVLVIVAAVAIYRYLHWKAKAIDYMNLLSEAQDKRRDIADDLRKKGLECTELKRDSKKLEKENKKLRRNK